MMHSRRGFTLVEILTALLVLSIGLASVMAIVTRSATMGTYASDRNNAAVLLPEAIADIEKYCLITRDMATKYPNLVEGELMDTMALGESGKNIYNDVRFEYPQGPTGTSQYPNPGFPFRSIAYVNGAASTNLAYWPFSTGYSRVMGMFPPISGASGKRGSISDNLSDITGPAYRALFKLETHPEWINKNVYPWTEDVNSAYVGVYVLTVAMYRDTEPQKSILKTTSPKHLEQLTDPVVVYLRDKRAR